MRRTRKVITSGASVLLQFWLQSRARSDLDGTPQPAVHCSEKRRVHMHPAFWPMQAFVFWADVLMLPWKMMMAPMADSMKCNSGRHKSGCYGRPRPGKSR
jgi:hypothetical protein